jgi:pyruvate/2-oxoglutarate dehydrogenase complex dihydrolipoamide acyltransferase (E2) component
MMYVALSYDHRLVDGCEAVTFLGADQRMRGGALTDPLDV